MSARWALVCEYADVTNVGPEHTVKVQTDAHGVWICELPVPAELWEDHVAMLAWGYDEMADTVRRAAVCEGDPSLTPFVRAITR